MHQSPEKKLARRREKYGDATLSEDQTSRRAWRELVPKARKFDLRDDEDRDDRGDPEPRRDRSSERRQ